MFASQRGWRRHSVSLFLASDKIDVRRTWPVENSETEHSTNHEDVVKGDAATAKMALSTAKSVISRPWETPNQGFLRLNSYVVGVP